MPNILDIALDNNTLKEMLKYMVATKYLEDLVAEDIKSPNKHCVGTAYLAPGHEAYSVGMAFALEKGDTLDSSHRDIGARMYLGRPIKRVALRRFLNHFGKKNGPTRGMDGTSHDHDDERGVGTFVSPMGAGAGVAVGKAFVHMMEGYKNVAVASFGEGASSAGRVHESMNLAGVLKFFKESTKDGKGKKLPVIFCCYNNQWAESVPVEDGVAGNLTDRFKSYGFSCVERIDGNDVIQVYLAVRRARKMAIEGKGPCAIEFLTFRVGPHGQHEAPDKYVPKEDIEFWKKEDKDPISRFKKYIFDKSILNNESYGKMFSEIKKDIDEAFDEAARAPEAVWDETYEDVFSPTADHAEPPSTSLIFQEKEFSYRETLSEALILEMKRDSKIVVFGQDVGWRMRGVFGEMQTTNPENGGSLKSPKAIEHIFGHERVFDTPIVESAQVAMGIGMAWQGWRPIVWIQFADFIATAIDDVKHAAWNYMRNRKAMPLVIMMPYGGGTGSGPFHSEDNMAMFCHMSGLKIVCPATPYDLAGLFRTAMRDNNPIMFYVHKTLFNVEKGKIPSEEYLIPFGKAKIYHQSNNANFTIIAWGAVLKEALLARKTLLSHGIIAEVIDPRTLVPFDLETVLKSFRKTGHAVIAHEASLNCGFGAEIASLLVYHAPDCLGGVGRVAGKDTCVPHAPKLEKGYLPNAAKIVEASLKIWNES